MEPGVASSEIERSQIEGGEGGGEDAGDRDRIWMSLRDKLVSISGCGAGWIQGSVKLPPRGRSLHGRVRGCFAGVRGVRVCVEEGGRLGPPWRCVKIWPCRSAQAQARRSRW